LSPPSVSPRPESKIVAGDGPTSGLDIETIEAGLLFGHFSPFSGTEVRGSSYDSIYNGSRYLHCQALGFLKPYPIYTQRFTTKPDCLLLEFALSDSQDRLFG
jgi:hypothetical protein